MSMSKEADLTLAVLLYAMRCVAEGDQQALRSLNFGPQELDALMKLDMGDLYGVDALGVHCLKIDLNREVFWPMLDHLRHQREAQDLQRKLLAADAPFEMLQHFFGMSAREYGRLRKMLTLAPATGRPPELKESATHTLWYAWQALVQDADGQSLSAQQYLDLHTSTGIGLRSLWAHIQRWEAYGDGLTPVAAARSGVHVRS